MKKLTVEDKKLLFLDRLTKDSILFQDERYFQIRGQGLACKLCGATIYVVSRASRICAYCILHLDV